MRKAKKEKNLKFVDGKDGKPGYYMTDITLNYRRIRRFAGRTKEAAREYLAKLRLAAMDGKLDDFINPKPAVNTFGEYARALLDSAEWKAKRSAKRNELSFRNLSRAFKDVRLQDINAGLVRKYITDRMNEGLAPATINREISFLKSVLYQAEYDGVIASNPIRGRRVRKLEEKNSREKTILDLSLTDDDLRRLIDCAADHLKPIIALALITGMRRGEILKMRWKDIDFTLGMIRVPAENSKTKKERYVPIDSNLIAMLDSIEKKGDYVFMNPETGKRIKDVKTAFKTALKTAGIKGLRFHDLRHLAAYRLVKVTDIVTASKILGHSDVKMTMRYIHPTEKDKREAIEKASKNMIAGRQKDVNGEISRALKGLENKVQIH